MRAEAQPPHRRWPWFIGAAAILVAILVAVIVLGHSPSGPSKSTPARPETSSTPTTRNSTVIGCLGGQNRDAAMVLSAANAAGHSQSGAVELAASFTRWIQRYPYPIPAEAAEVGDRVLAKKSFTTDLSAYLASKPDLSGGIVATGTTYYMNTVPGVWYIESAQPKRVTVSIGSGYVIEGSLSPTLRSSITVTMVLEGNQWKISDAKGTRTPTDLYRIGHPFTDGC